MRVSNKPIPQIPRLISHNTPFTTEVCSFLFWIVHCGMWDRCIVGFENVVYTNSNYHFLCERTEPFQWACELKCIAYVPSAYIYIYIYIHIYLYIYTEYSSKIMLCLAQFEHNLSLECLTHFVIAGFGHILQHVDVMAWNHFLHYWPFGWEPASRRWILLNALCRYLLYWPEQTIAQTVDWPIIETPWCSCDLMVIKARPRKSMWLPRAS